MLYQKLFKRVADDLGGSPPKRHDKHHKKYVDPTVGFPTMGFTNVLSIDLTWKKLPYNG